LLLSPIGLIVTATAGMLAYFGHVGAAIEWLKDAWKSLFETAAKAWQGIQNALAAGRLDLAFQVAWAGINLVWTQGINFLYTKWLDFQSSFLAAWDACVYQLAALLIDGWSGLEMFWYDSIKEIQTAWLNLCKVFTDAWDAASSKIAKGLAGIYAKMSGLDAKEMIRIVEENHVTRQNQRNKNYQTDRDKLEKKTLEAQGRIKEQRKDSLNALDSGYEQKKDARKSGHEAEIERMEADTERLQQELDASVKEAADAKVQLESDEKNEKKARKFQMDAEELTSSETSKMTGSSSGGKSGTFSAFEMGAVRGNVIENTLKTQLKYQAAANGTLDKIYRELEGANEYA
jgi:hypothetical protein